MDNLGDTADYSRIPSPSDSLLWNAAWS